ncbi:MAG: hypothetical protein K8W52_22905 [Deltaproteobacteria bacterium]|nr:hypothetical protein [Deltaproteobacteria bacterium]
MLTRLARHVAPLALAALAACNVNPYDLGGSGSGSDSGTPTIDSNSNGDGNGSGIDAPPPDGTPPDACLPSPEVCNNADDDCDGVPDNGFDTTQDPNNCGTCGHKCAYVNAFGTCTASTCARGACKPGYYDLDSNPADCEYFCIQTNGGVETCDNVDNDCDGTVDNGFNTQSDLNNCGTCGHQCNTLNATPVCDTGTCKVDSCNPGFVDLNGSPNDGCEYQCTPSNGGVELCDGIDNNCDGFVDDGNPGGGATCGTDTGECTAGTTVCSFGVLFCVGSIGGGSEVCNNLDDDCNGVVDNGFNKQTDPQHCGSCSPCVLDHATPGCSNGGCTVASCAFGYVNLDNVAGNGCEYSCIATGAETCDNADNDCDGVVDDGFNVMTDKNNCGSCGNQCSFTNAAASCVMGGCVMGTCAANFYDLDNNPATGCEYGCVKTNGGVEICDGQDNNCDGVIDNGNPGGGGSCGTNTGECTAGTLNCVGGALVCQGQVTGNSETCNNLDDDCNGVVDNGFDKLNDPRFCNNCAGCSLPHAIAGCSAGGCTVAACLSGYVNANGTIGDGCEYACTFTGAEVCDGIDNDCDGLIDAADPSMTAPANFCKTAGECAGTTPSCTGAGGWDCLYTDPDVEKDAGGDVVLQETRCDGKDNDCDGLADDPFPLKNTACAEDGTNGTTRKLGTCRGSGTLVCNGAQTGLTCSITTPGATPVAESCDNKDNDCDGHTDEPYDSNGFAGVRDATVGPLTINGKSVVMYKYEASRPDATGANPGFVETRACSSATKLPWANPTLAKVQAACSAAGMRLCKVTRNGSGVITSDEWGRFCEGASNRTFPYGNTFAGTTCNGSVYDPVAGGVNEDQAVATGSLAGCVSQDLAFDMSGNLKEWTDDARVAGAQTVYTLRGGSFDNQQNGLTCDFDLTVVPTTYSFANTGFRCCGLSCPAGQSECSGACTDLSTNVNSCGACGRTCGAGEGCFNGYCCPSGTVLCPGTDQCKPAGQC